MMAILEDEFVSQSTENIINITDVYNIHREI